MSKRSSFPKPFAHARLLPLFFSILFFSSSSVFAGEKNSARVTALYKEMTAFKDKPEFHQKGFDTCCVYSKWLKKAQALRSDSTLTFHESFAAASVIALAKAYRMSRGKENEDIKTARNDYVSALAWQLKLDTEKKIK